MQHRRSVAVDAGNDVGTLASEALAPDFQWHFQSWLGVRQGTLHAYGRPDLALHWFQARYTQAVGQHRLRRPSCAAANGNARHTW